MLAMAISYDETVHALHIRFGRGRVEETVEIEPLVLVDLDSQRGALGNEFVDATDFLPFLMQHGGNLNAGMLALLADAASPHLPF